MRLFHFARNHHLDLLQVDFQVTPPYVAMFSSVPFIALIIAQFGNLYGLTMSLTATPQFLKRVLNFNLKGSAFIAALPQLSRLVCGFFFGYINDSLLRKGVPKQTCRKGFTILCKYLLYLLFSSYCG